MDNNEFAIITSIVQKRRNVKPFAMNGHKIPNGHVAALLELADWAPTHGYTEPWRFVVYENPLEYCAMHANLYRENTSDEEFNENTYNSILTQGEKASHAIIAVQKRGHLPKIPVFEEIIATSCAVENLLLGATALNIAAYWGTGGMVLKQAMKDYLQLGEEDHVLGILYLGYTEEQLTGKRNTPLEQKITWHKA
jgi:nitroreductase